MGDYYLRSLIVDDDFTNRRLLQRLLDPFFQCDIAVGGKEAVEAFEVASKEGKPYDLICLDIMMPEMDGHQTLKKIRAAEEQAGIQDLDRAKVLMTTALDDNNNIMNAFRSQCDAYLVKPVSKTKLLEHLYEFGFIEKTQMEGA